MKKNNAPTTTDNTWDMPSETSEGIAPGSAETKITSNKSGEFDLEGLMTDFPTARDLERFLFDRTGVALDLKGRSNKFKYTTALDILNGSAVPTELIAQENPYLDKTDIVPEEPMKPVPPRPEEVHNAYLVTQFHSRTFPHPDPDFKAQGQKCDVVFRKYTNNVITYEILGPIARRAIGTRINKYGQEVPEKYVWIDPRTGEQVIRTESGMLTPLGTRLKAFMQKQKVNKTTVWDAWIDREFILTGEGAARLDDPWN
jgi:hypothetical protein